MSKKPKSRTVSLEGDTLTITEDGKRQQYLLTDVGSPDAKYGIVLDKITEDGEVIEVYNCEVYPASGHHSCTCWGWMRWQHCRHVESIVALDKAGKMKCGKATV